MQEMLWRRGFEPWVRKIPWEKEMATHSRILAWRIPRTEEPGGLQSTGVAKSWTWLSDWTELKFPLWEHFCILTLSLEEENPGWAGLVSAGRFGHFDPIEWPLWLNVNGCSSFSFSDITFHFSSVNFFLSFSKTSLSCVSSYLSKPSSSM